MKFNLLFLMILLIIALSAVNAQTNDEPLINIEEIKFDCSNAPEYLDINKQEKKTLTVQKIKGVTVLYAAENFYPNAGRFFRGACVALFTEKEHKLVAKTVSGKNGIFSFENIAGGDYRLVVTHPYGLTNAANIPIRIIKPESKGRRKKIMIYMIGNNFAADSYASIK